MEKNKKWYVVKYESKRYSARIFDRWTPAKNFAKSHKTYAKSFDTKEEAILYAGYKLERISFQLTPVRSTKICLLCEKPFKTKTKLCPHCNKQRKLITEKLITSEYSWLLKLNSERKYFHGYKSNYREISVGDVVLLKQWYPNDNPFVLLSNNPNLLETLRFYTSKRQRAEIRKARDIEFSSSEYCEKAYKKEGEYIPAYVKELFENNSTKTFLFLGGERLNPNIYYLCKCCGKEQNQKYQSLRAGYGHNCDVTKPSGEVLVAEYLEQNKIPFIKQYETIKCVNPKTQKILPYDFELLDKKIIIEVQGEQHCAFSLYFHGSQENFDYQLWKDEYKKQYAEKNGYTVVYIYYQDIKDKKFQEKIQLALKSS